MARTKLSLAQQMDEAIDRGYSWCRANMHIWKPDIGGIQVIAPKRGAQVAVVRYNCENCGGFRQDSVVVRSGELVTRMYHYPAGYQMKVGRNGDEKPTKSDWRARHFKRLVKEVNN